MNSNKEYFYLRQEQAIDQLPSLVKILGYIGAYEELSISLAEDELLNPEEVVTIAEEAVWRYWCDK